MWLELLAFLIGIAFGFFHRGTEDYRGILRNGAALGIVMGVLAVLMAIFLSPRGTGTTSALSEIPGMVLTIVVFVVILVVGTFIGDRIERLVRG